MARRNIREYITSCIKCGRNTQKKYARTHAGQCKACAEGLERPSEASRWWEERNARLLEHGYDAYAREEGHY